MKRSTTGSKSEDESIKRSKMNQQRLGNSRNDETSPRRQPATFAIAQPHPVNDNVASSIRNELTNLLRQRFAATVLQGPVMEMQRHQPLAHVAVANLSQIHPSPSHYQSMIRTMGIEAQDSDNSSRERLYEQLHLMSQGGRQQPLLQTQAQVVAQNQQRQDAINRLRREILVMQVQEQEGRDYALLGRLTASVPQLQINELRNMQQHQIHRQMLLNRFSTLPTLELSDRSMELSLQRRHDSYTATGSLPMSAQQLLEHSRQSMVSTALGSGRLNGIHGTSQNISVTGSSFPPVPAALPVLLVRPNTNESRLSHRQRLLRQQLEVFEANHEDVTTHTRGRNKPISYGQVGIRCKHCAHVAVLQRQKGSTYFPSTKLGLYQAAQNMCTTHIQSGVCEYMPESIKLQFSQIADNLQCDTKSSNSNHGAGRPYWLECASQLGLVDTEDHGIRFIRNVPSNAVLIDEGWNNPSERIVAAPER